MAAPGASGPLASSKRCPQCGALAGLNAPVCATCGRAFRGTIGQGAPAAPPVVGPTAIGPLPTPTATEADEVSAGNRNGALLVLLFVVGTVFMAVVASGLEKNSGPGAKPAPPIPGVSKTNRGLFRNPSGIPSEHPATPA